jgi:hypothetical protein
MTKSGEAFLPYLVAPRVHGILIDDNQVKTMVSMLNLDTVLFNSTERLFLVKSSGLVRTNGVKKVDLLCARKELRFDMIDKKTSPPQELSDGWCGLKEALS